MSNKIFRIMVMVLLIVSFFPAAAFSDQITSQQINLEKRYLKDKKERQLSLCQSANDKKSCRNGTVKWYNRSVRELNSDPELYFYKKDKRDFRRAIRKAVQ